MRVPIKRLPGGEGLPLPSAAHSGDAGLDLRAAEDVALYRKAVVSTGFSIAIPPGYVGLICPRSGLARHDNIGVLNAPGILDAGFRGEVEVILYRTVSVEAQPYPYQITRGQRIAQLLILPFPAIEWEETDDLGETERGASGFGSSGA
jgi:dUTP pyrophosphatase